MTLLSGLLGGALAANPPHAEASRPQAADTTQIAWDADQVRAGLTDALPELLAEAARDCGVDRVRYQADPRAPIAFDVSFTTNGERTGPVHVRTRSFAADGSAVLAVKTPLGKAGCVDASLASHTIVFADPDDEWAVRGACTVSAVPAPTFSRPFDLAQYKAASIACTFPPVLN